MEKCLLWGETGERYFETTKEKLEEACKKVNERILRDEYMYWNDAISDLYKDLGAPDPTQYKWPVGGDIILEWDEAKIVDLASEGEEYPSVKIERGCNELAKSHVYHRLKLEALKRSYELAKAEYECYKARVEALEK